MMCRVYLLLSVVFVSNIIIQPGSGANAGLACTQDAMMEDFEKSLMSCMIHSVDPELMIKIIENIKHPEKMFTLNFVCGYQADVAKLMDCMVHKYSTCLPSEVQKLVTPLLPTEERWRQIIKIACDNRKLLGEQCMTQDASSQFIKCYKTNLQQMSSLIGSLSSSKDLTPLLCQVRQSYRSCISTNSGTCTAKYFSLLDEIMSMAVSLPNCPNTGNKIGSPFDAILFRGHPLKFQPFGKVN